MATLGDEYEAVTKLMGESEPDVTAAAPHYKALLNAAVLPETNILLRAKILGVIGQHGALFEESLLRDAMQAMVKTFGTQDDSAVLLAGINGLVGLAKRSAELKTKKAEFVVREAADLLMQLAMDETRPNEVRQAAEKNLLVLVAADFKAVVTKLLHWLSDDREDDDASHLDAERVYALERLTFLASNKSYDKQWTDDVYSQLMRYLTAVLPTITLVEFSRLVSCLVQLPQLRETHSAPLVEAVLSPGVKYKDDRLGEMLLIVAQALPRTQHHDVLALRLTTELSKLTATDEPKNALLGRTAVAAARLISDAQAEKVVGPVLAALNTVTQGFHTPTGTLPENLTAFEGLLVALNILGYKSAIPVIDYLTKVETTTLFANLQSQAASVVAPLTFAVKKLLTQGKATQHHAALLGSVANIQHLAASFAQDGTKLAPITTLPSWEKSLHLPKLKKPLGGQTTATGQATGTYVAGNGARATKRRR